MSDIMLTTIDNPYDPFTDLIAWFNWDAEHNYHSPALLARVAVVADSQSDSDQEKEIERAIREIVKENLSGMHSIAYR